jgi:Phage terminase, small subunit
VVTPSDPASPGSLSTVYTGAKTGFRRAPDPVGRRPKEELLAQFADERERWLAQATDEGVTHTTRHGAIRVHPGVGEARRLQTAMVQILSLLDLSPADRSRLGLSEVRRMSSLADLMQRRRDALGR